MGRRRFAAIVALLALAVGVGVGSAGAAPRGGGETLTVWVPPVFPNAQKAQLQRWAKESGNKVDIQVFPNPFEQNVLAKWATGERPDILFFHAIGNWLPQLNPAKTLIPMDKEPFVKRTIPGILPKSSTFQGHIYGAVLNYPYIDGMFYNRKVFKDAGVALPKNYGDLLKVCEQLKQKAPGVAPIYIGGGDQWPLQVLAFMMWNDDLKKNPGLINSINTAKTKWTNPVFVRGIQAEKDLQDKGCLNKDILTAKFEDEQKSIMSGKAAMVFQGTWMIGSLLDAYGTKKMDATLGLAGLSRSTDVASWQTTGTGAAYAPKTGNSDKEKAAVSFINFATGKDFPRFLKESKQFSILKGYKAPPDVPQVARKANALFLKDSVPQFQQTLQAAYGPFETFLQEMIAGKKTPLQVAESLQQEFEKSAKQLKLPGYS